VSLYKRNVPCLFILYLAGAIPITPISQKVDEDEIAKNIKALKLQGSPRVNRGGRKNKPKNAPPSPNPSE
jgi:signal recognition particle receptor subunit alpha